MTIELIIDYREDKLIKLLTEKKLEYKTSNLELGDIIFKYTKNEKLILEFIIERKEINDLIASIKDKRYKEQKQRIFANINQETQVIYLIEGYSSKIRNPRDIKMYHGSLLSMLFRDNIKLIHTEDLDDTADIIERLYNRLKKNAKEFISDVDFTPIQYKGGESGDSSNNETIVESKTETKTIDITMKGGSYLETRVKKKKSDNITPENCSILMLTYLPGISSQLAIEILKHFENKISLLLSYLTNKELIENEKIKYISTLKIQTVSGKERNIGPSIARTLIEYLN